MRNLTTATALSVLALAGAAPAAAFGRKDAPDLETLLKQHTEAVEKTLTDLGLDTKTAKARLDDLEQKLARPRGNPAYSRAPTPGQLLVESDDMKGFLGHATAGRRIGVEVKAVLTGATGSGGDLWVPDRDMTLALPKRPLRVRDLLPTIQVSTGTVEYPRQTTRTIGAATVAEGALKPSSDFAFDLVSVPIRTIAHWTLASRQILDDAPQLQGFIDSELIYGLDYVEDNQLLNGAGTGTDLNGIYPQATAFDAGSLVVASPTKIDVIGAAILQNNLANLPADGIVLHPSDWTGILMTKDSQGRYLFGDPQAMVQPRLFGLPVVPTAAMTAGTFLVGNFRDSATFYDRMAARIEISTEDSDNFRKNLVTVLAEERVGLAVKRPTGFTKGTFAAAITDLTS